jgi:molecular chaperone DnaK (HSP70)
VSVVYVEDDLYEVKASNRNENLGGEGFDQLLVCLLQPFPLKILTHTL